MLQHQRMFQGVVFLALPLAALSCRTGQHVPNPTAAGDRASDEAAIRARVAAYETAVNRRDAAAVANLYTTNGDLIIYDGPRVLGREAIRRGVETDLSAMSATLRISIEVTDIRFLGPDLAIVETLARFNEGDVRENRGTSVMVREAGNWLHAALRVIAAQRRRASAAAGSLDGAWRLVVAKPVDSTGQLSPYSPGASLFIFAATGHYSMAWTRGRGADQPFAQRWNPTDAERIARYNALTMNAGTYTVAGSTLTIRPLVARAPEYIGGTGTYEFRISGDTLFLTDLSIVSFDNVPVPGLMAGGRYHHTLVRLR